MRTDRYSSPLCVHFVHFVKEAAYDWPVLSVCQLWKACSMVPSSSRRRLHGPAPHESQWGSEVF